MKREWLVKTLALGIVVLFIVSGETSAFNVNQDDKSYTTTDNHPPGAPNIRILGGSTFMKPGIHEFKFKAIDPDGDNISYEIDWGDGYYEWTDWYASGEEITRNHSYPVCATYVMIAKATDIHNATGDGAGMMIVIPKSKQIINLPFLHFLKQFQYVFATFKYFFNWR